MTLPIHHPAWTKKKPSSTISAPPNPTLPMQLSSMPHPPPRTSSLSTLPPSTDISQVGYHDFRGNNHAVNGHWNDAPDALFHTRHNISPGNLTDAVIVVKDVTESGIGTMEEMGQLDAKMALFERVYAVYSSCEDRLSQDKMQKRVLEDAKKRLEHLKQRLLCEDDQGVSTASLVDLYDFISALEKDAWETATLIHVRMMQHDYEREGKWVLGMKRLLELKRKCASISS